MFATTSIKNTVLASTQNIGLAIQRFRQFNLWCRTRAMPKKESASAIHQSNKTNHKETNHRCVGTATQAVPTIKWTKMAFHTRETKRACRCVCEKETKREGERSRRQEERPTKGKKKPTNTESCAEKKGSETHESTNTNVEQKRTIQK